MSAGGQGGAGEAPVVVMEGITKRFGALTANDHVDFTLYPGETHALVGENGAGKTTLMRVLYGQYIPDEGSVYVNGVKSTHRVAGALKLGVGMVHQNFMQIDDMSILENIILGHAPTTASFINYSGARKKIRQLLERFGMKKVSLTAPVGTLCVGERQKVEIMKALYQGARILILDEPTAVLTPQESSELFSIIDELKKDGTSIIFISHKLREVIQVADRITVMRKGGVVAHFRRGEAQEIDVARAMIGKQDVQLIQNTKRGQTGEEACRGENLWYIDGSGIPRVRNFSFHVNEGEILGIGGVEGNGQTELINLLIGMYGLSAGRILLDGEDISQLSIRHRRSKGIGYSSEDRMTTGLALQATIDENLICGVASKAPFSRHGVLSGKAIAANTMDLIRKFDIRGISKGKPVKALSGGNMQKIVLAREISRRPKLLIAAQPTRGLDIGAINFVREHLLEQKQQGTAVILVSADLEELMSLSDRILIMYDGRCSGEVTDIASVTEEEIGLMMGGITHSQAAKGAN